MINILNKRNVLIICGAVIVLAGGIVLTTFKEKDNGMSDENVKKILSNIEVKEEGNEKFFNSFDEMEEYVSNLDVIAGVDEASIFIKNFMNDCLNNSIEDVLGYFKKDIWASVIKNEIFPMMDTTFSTIAEYTDIKVSQSGGKFIVEYMLNIKDKIGTTLAKITRKDSYSLEKEMGQIRITDYNRVTLGTEKLY